MTLGQGMVLRRAKRDHCWAVARAVRRSVAGQDCMETSRKVVSERIATGSLVSRPQVTAGIDDDHELVRSTAIGLQPRWTDPGAPLCLAGDPGTEVFVVPRGTVAIVDGRTLDSTLLRVETIGSVIGGMAVLDSAPRSASAFAVEGGAHVLRLDENAFGLALNAGPRVAEGVMRTLARRIRTREYRTRCPLQLLPQVLDLVDSRC